MGRCDVVIPTLAVRNAERAVDCIIRSSPPGLVGHISVVLAPHHIGCVGQYEAGWRGGDSPYVALVNDDAFLTGKALTELLRIMEADPKIGAIGPNLPGQTHQGKLYPPEAESLVDVPFVIASCMVVRRSALVAIGGCETGFQHWAFDLDLCYRLRENGWRVVWAQHVWVNHLQSQEAPEGELAEISKRDHALLEERWPGKLLREANIPMSPPPERPKSPEAIASVQRFHRDIIQQFGKVPVTWDLGCGEGWGADAYEPGTLVGFDSDLLAIEAARQRYPQHRWVHANLDDPLESTPRAKPDRIIAIQSLEHLSSPETVVYEIARRWLKRGGEFFMSVPIEELTLYHPFHLSYRT